MDYKIDEFDSCKTVKSKEEIEETKKIGTIEKLEDIDRLLVAVVKKLDDIKAENKLAEETQDSEKEIDNVKQDTEETLKYLKEELDKVRKTVENWTNEELDKIRQTVEIVTKVMDFPGNDTKNG